jgi:hypothetical protein
MADETKWVLGSGGAVFEVVVTPRILKKLKSGVLQEIEPPKNKRGPTAAAKAKEAEEAKAAAESEAAAKAREADKPAKGDGKAA